jgi:type IV pilus assembly protein PilA
LIFDFGTLEETLQMRKQKGFSLIELLIVVAIILIIAAIAIPNLLRSRMSANESAAASSLRTLNTTEVTYQTSYPASGYAPSLQTLGPNAIDCSVPANVDSTHACLIDNILGCASATACPKGQYNYAIVSTAAAVPYPDYTASAWPLSAQAGSKSYCSMSDAVVRFEQKVETALVPLATCNTPATFAPLAN